MTEVKSKACAAKEKAWNDFLNRFPKAGKSKFVAEAHFDDKHNATAGVFFKESEGSYQSVLGSDRRCWSDGMKKALGLGDSGGFPYQLAPLGSKVSLSIPAVPFDGAATSLKKIFNAEKKFTSRLTNISPQNLEKHFRKPNLGTQQLLNQNYGW